MSRCDHTFAAKADQPWIGIRESPRWERAILAKRKTHAPQLTKDFYEIDFLTGTCDGTQQASPKC